MRLIHTSDLHMGSPLTARLPHEKIRQRKRELLSTFRRMVEEGARLGVSAVIIAGDLFDSENVGVRTVDEAAAVIAGAPEITFYYLTGNHEKNAFADAGLPLPENLRIFDTGWTYFDVGSLTIAGRSECAAGMFDTLSLSPERKNIVVLHGELRDRSAPECVIGEKEIPEDKVDLLCLGHYHTYAEKKINRRTTAIYCGTPEGRGFDETGDKGFVLLDVREKKIETSFIPFAKRRLHEVSADISVASRALDVHEAVREAIRDIPEKDLVRVVLTGERMPELRYDTETIVERFGHEYYHFEVRDASRLALHPDDYRFDKSLKGEFIRLVSEEASLSEDERDAVIRCGLRALAGED